jgi:integrase/recombinase XerD
VKRELIEENPVEEIDLESDIGIEFNATKKSEKAKEKSEHGIVYIYPEDKEKMCKSENLPTPKDRSELIIRLLWQTGIRRQELRDLKIDNIDRQDRVIKVWSDKTDDTRKVTYKPSLETLLDVWQTQRRALKHSDSPYLLITERSEQIGLTTIGKTVRKAAENARIQERLYTDGKGHNRYLVTPHTLRHSFAVWSVRRRDESDSKMDIRTLQKAMGHDSISTTESYLQFQDSDYLDELRRCSPGGTNR